MLHFEQEVFLMKKTIPVFLVLALLFSGTAILAEGTAPAPAPQSNSIDASKQAPAKQASKKKHHRHHHKGKKTKKNADPDSDTAEIISIFNHDRHKSAGQRMPVALL